MLKLDPTLDLIAGEPEPRLTENALRVLEKRYLRRNESGKVIETPRELFWRVAWNLAQADALYGAPEAAVVETAKRFYRLIANLEFLPNSPTLMNAGLDLQQLSACFVLPVEDSLAGIFQTLKESALIHQSGGGCVAGDSHVYTTFCGVERIETLYERVRALGIPEEPREGHRVMDVSALGIRTFAVDPATGEFAAKPVTHLWSWDVPPDRRVRVRCSDGTEVTTSEWHPFLVLTADGVAERRAEALGPGDVLIAPNRTVRSAWPFTRHLEQEGFVLDERLAWLTGFFLGDGSLGRFRNPVSGYRALRLRFFDGRPENIRFAQDVLAGCDVSVTPQRDRRGLWFLTTTNAKFVPRFARVARADPGPKVALTLPEWVAKSPLPVVAAFLGGLIDSDGYVSLERRRIEFSTVCPELATRLVSLLSAMGFHPSIHVKAPRGRAKHAEYRVHMADAKKTPELVALVRGWVHDSLRARRLELLTERLSHNTHPRVPMPFALVERLLAAAGVPTRTSAIHRSAISVGGERVWLHRAKWGDGIGEDKLRRLIKALRPITPEGYRPVLDQLEHIADGWTTVEAVEQAPGQGPFYDLTVADHNTYLAGGGLGQMTVVHNTGFSFSRLRPKNDFVRSTMGVASGPVSFMKVFDAATQQVKQGSRRRGANMGILRVDHPDIEEFIACKDDVREITNFNISVAVTDRFMDAVRKGEKYDLVNPRDGKPVKQLDAREVFEKIAHQAWKNGEPGLFFIDETNRRQPTPHIGAIEATNPCVAGDTMVSTERGLVTIAELARRYPDGGISVITDRRVPAEVVTESGGLLLATGDQAAQGTRLGPIVGAWRSGVKPTWRIVTKSGLELTATADHKVLTTDGWICVEDLVPGKHILLVQSGPGRFPDGRALPFRPTNARVGRNGKTTALSLPDTWSRELGLALGWLVGDGWIRTGDRNCRVGFTFSRTDAPIFAMLRPVLDGWYGRKVRAVQRANGVYHLSYHSQLFVGFFLELGARPVDSGEKEVPVSLFQAPGDVVTAFLQALFTADGTVRDNPRSNSSWIALTSRSRRLLQGTQLLLLNLGIRSHILDRSRPARETGFEYTRKDGTRRSYRSDGVLYELAIFGESRERFRTEVGFLDEKQARLSSVRFRGFREARWEDPLVMKEPAGEREVFDLTEPMSHSMICQGLVIRQCGEQPLLPYESCNLGSINLERHMARGKKGKWDVDWPKLERTVRLAVRMLDNVIDMNEYPVKQIEEMTKATRKIGLGVMGFARMLFMLEVPYDSKEGVEWGRRVMEFIRDAGCSESQKLAEERGPYPAWEGSVQWREGVKMRNSYVTTVAPTGTLSMLADTSGGCEPEFSLTWFKRVMEGEQLPYFLEYFEEVARREGFWSPDLAKRVLENNGRARGLKGVPEKWQRAFAVSHDVSPEWHVRMQAAFQEHSDSAVSKTINMPRDATVEDVKKAYLLAHDLHCKGITVYRDGSREDQVLNVGVAEAEKAKPAAAAPLITRPRRRPDVITGRTQKILTGYGPLYVTVNEDDKGLFELFAQIGRGGGYTASFTEGIARLVSLCLRSGVPVDEIIDQLEGIRSPRLALDHGERIYSIPDAIAKAIKRHIGMQKTGILPPVESFDAEAGAVHVDDEYEKESQTEDLVKRGLNPECPECGRTLILEEGCAKCRHCGYSEC